MNKRLLALAAEFFMIISVTTSAHASVTKVYLSGTVKSFDLKTITLVDANQQDFKVPRAMVPDTIPLYEYQYLKIPIVMPKQKLQIIQGQSAAQK